VPRVVILTNFIPSYRVALFEAVASRVDDLRVILSTPMEQNRAWDIEWGILDVEVSRSLTLPRSRHHPSGYIETQYVHFPYDTIPRLLRLRPDVVISAELGLRSLQAAAYRALRPRSRLIIWATLSERTEAGYGRARVLVRRRLAARADGVFVNGESGVRYMRGLGVPTERVFTVPYTSRPTGEPPGDPVEEHVPRRLLFVGQLVERKGLVPFAEALHAWSAKRGIRGLELWVIGDGPERDRLASLTETGRVQMRIFGSVAPEEVRSIMARCDILVFPTLGDEWGLVVNEALAAGLPVLGSEHSQAVTELVTESVNGWIFRPDDRRSTESGLDRAIVDPSRPRPEMRTAARQSVEALAPDRVADRIVEGIEKVRTDPC
jgi:glycosyltransferase involved in cell wall biosynthesis